MIHLAELEGSTKSIRDRIKYRFQGECAYCGALPSALTLDHVKPRSKGGHTAAYNLIPACRPCNQAKGDKNVWEWWLRQPHWDETRVKRVCEILLENPFAEL